MQKPLYRVKNKDSKFPFMIKDDTAIQGIKEIKATNKYVYGVLNETSVSDNRKVVAVFDRESNPFSAIFFFIQEKHSTERIVRLLNIILCHNSTSCHIQ